MLEPILTVLITVAAIFAGWLVCLAARTAYRWFNEDVSTKPTDPPRELIS